MTREEAIIILGNIPIDGKDKCYSIAEYQEAKTMAIKALEQKPKTIQEMQAESEKYQKAFEDGYEQGYAQARFDYEQEPSRDIKEIAEIMKCDADAEIKCKMISNILNAKPHYFEEQEPKTGQGKWIEERTYMECSNCHDIWHYEENQTERFKYCPTCGERNEYESKYTRNGI